MTLDQAILHAEDVEKEMNYEYQECVATQDYIAAKQCAECAEKHRQLAEWLKDYKRLLEQEPILDKIRFEVMNLTDGETPERIWNIDVLRIIDKYKAESEAE